MRYLCLYRPLTGEEGGMPTPEHMASMNALVDEMTRAGKLIKTEPLGMRSLGAVVRREGGKLTVKEPAERAGGYAFVNAGSREELIELIDGFLEVAGDGECEVRQVLEFGPPPT